MVVCLHCKTPFNIKRKTQRFCNTTCYLNSEYKKEYNKKNCKNYYFNKGGKEKRKYRFSRRKHWIDKYKIVKGCSRCGFNAHSVCLDFDHINPFEKCFNISRAINDLQYSVKTIIDEIRKCKILCSNCHRILTKEQNLYYNKRHLK